METAVLIRERYKIVRVTEAENEYAFAETVDIAERETPVRLLNLYEGACLTEYVRIYAELQDYPAFCEAFLTENSLAAVFEPCDGIPINRVFYRGAKWSWQDRLLFAEQIFHQALGMANLPPAVSCAAMLSENVRVDVEKKRIGLWFRIRPLRDMNARELTLLASDQVRKVLQPRFAQGDAEYAFYTRLLAGEFPSIVPLYACWRRAAEEIAQEYTELDKKNGFQRWIALLWKNTKRILKRERR